MTEEKRLPHRVQLKRTKGYRIEPNTTICDRRSVWGNWYKAKPHPAQKGLWTILDTRNGYEVRAGETKPCATNSSVGKFDIDIIWMRKEERREWLKPLLGKNLACWCSGASECHCDVLFKWLEIEFGQEYEVNE